MNNIKAEIVAYSTNQQGDKIMSVLATFPRIILAEVNTHRMLSKNTSSSRAIPFIKMVQAIMENPFIPIAWQKNHPGMQGTEYLSKTDKFCIDVFMESMHDTLSGMLDKKSPEYLKSKKAFDEKMKLLSNLLDNQILAKELIDEEKTLDQWWLFARDRAVEAASMLYIFDVTKQLDNRILEPFMWTTMLITGPESGWENFFRLRRPSYEWRDYEDETNVTYYRSRKEWLKQQTAYDKVPALDDTLFWGLANKGQAEIHIMDLAEKIWDAVNESTPRQLKAGEWHIPFEDKIDIEAIKKLTPKPPMGHPEEDSSYLEAIWYGDITDNIIKISTAMAARTSYTVVGDEKGINYQKMIELHDRLLTQEPPHSSPFEHCAKCMSTVQRLSFIKGIVDIVEINEENKGEFVSYSKTWGDDERAGWCYNLKGFIPYRYLVDNKIDL